MIEVVNMRTCDPPWGSPEMSEIDRTTKWGNPYPITDTNCRSDVIVQICVVLKNAIKRGELDVSELSGAKRLGCHCKPKSVSWGCALSGQSKGFQNPGGDYYEKII